MQSILGALLTAGYGAAVATKISASGAHLTDQVTSELERSYSSAAAVAQADPQNAQAIIAGAKSSFLSGANWSYTAGALLIALGALLVWTMFPSKDRELELLDEYRATDTSVA
jgi:hypothetical protein